MRIVTPSLCRFRDNGVLNSIMNAYLNAYSVDTLWQPLPLCADPRLRRWLLGRGSLTRRIQSRCEHFHVDLLLQRLAAVGFDECGLVRARPGASVLVREVTLNCGTRPLVFAHSVVEPCALRGPWHMLMTLGTRPLGAAVFSNPRVERYALRFRKIGRQHALYRHASEFIARPPPTLWARRSVFVLRNSRLLVTEVFLPAILHLAP
jgi:chorismate lyase